MTIGVCGFGSSGSSAVSDYLSEYENLSVVDGLEFTWVSGVDGIVDLEYHVMHPHNRTADSIAAIQRFEKRVRSKQRLFVVGCGMPKDAYIESAKSFINSITDVQWFWLDFTKTSFFSRVFEGSILTQRLYPRLERFIGKQLKCYPYKRVSLSVNPSNFYVAAKKHVRELLLGLGADLSKPVVLDQPFSGNNPECCFPFFDDPYAIVVDRDPRDTYVFSNTRLLGKNHFMASSPVEDFVKYYRSIRKDQPYMMENQRTLSLRFEDMVYDYKPTTERIRQFLNLPKNPNPMSIFDPKLSIANTQVWKRFPQYQKDIEYIEAELPEYLFDFERFGDIQVSGEMFFGKSPLHKR